MRYDYHYKWRGKTMAKTILIIDDDETIIKLMAQFLERAGYEVLTADNGHEGIDKYRTFRPDLIVLDIAMPELNGFEVTKTIRQIQHTEGWPRTPIIILTAYARSFFISAGSEAGIDSYLTKPILPEQLLEHLNQFLADSPQSSDA